MADNVQFKDFSKKRRPVEFMLDEEKFSCAPAVPIESLQEIAQKAGTIDGTNAADALKLIFAVVMDEDNTKRIHARMSDKVNPLDMEQALEIMNWLLEVYGLRPTQPSSDTSNGSPTGGDGTLSTAGVSVTE